MIIKTTNKSINPGVDIEFSFLEMYKARKELAKKNGVKLYISSQSGNTFKILVALHNLGFDDFGLTRDDKYIILEDNIGGE